MNILGLNIEFAKSAKKQDPETIQTPQPEARLYQSDTIIPLGSIVLPFNGEKNVGEMGPATTYIPDYYILSTRSWQAYTDSPLAKTGVNKWADWIIDSGLKLKANPAKIVLKSEGIEMDKVQSEEFNDLVESRFEVWANSKESSWTGEETFNECTKSIYVNGKIGGDVLVILRLVNGIVKIQYIDGQRVQSPSIFNTSTPEGNIISNGVEISPTGKVVAYHVVKPGSLQTETIKAYSKEGLRVAFLYKGTKWRMDYHRGMPVISTVLETLSKIDRYREATVGSAEEVAKIAYQVVHDNYSDGSSPLIQQLAKAAGNENGLIPEDVAGNKLANNIAVTMGKQAFNNPKGAKIETINQGNNLQGFESFHDANANIIFACIGIPPNVALSLYNDSFSASRAATKDWDHTMDVERNDLVNQFYKYVYRFWLYVEILKNKVQAPGYLQAFASGKFMITESYEKMRFTGSHFPHIDPVKEVRAEREKLGALGKNLPLTTLEAATESLGSGDSDSNLEQFSDEMAIAESLNIKEKEDPIPPNPDLA